MKCLKLSLMVLNSDLNVVWQESSMMKFMMRHMMREGWHATGIIPGLNMTVWIPVSGFSAYTHLCHPQHQTWSWYGMVLLWISLTMSAMFVSQMTFTLNGTEKCQSTMLSVCLEEVGIPLMFGQYVFIVSVEKMGNFIRNIFYCSCKLHRSTCQASKWNMGVEWKQRIPF